MTADTVNPTHVQLLPSFRLFFFSKRSTTQAAYHFDINIPFFGAASGLLTILHKLDRIN